MPYSKLFFGSDTQNEVLVKQLASLTSTFGQVTIYVSKYLVANSNSASVLVVVLLLLSFLPPTLRWYAVLGHLLKLT